MTNEAIHDRMKTLKDSVVKSEDSVKRLVAEIKMLGQRVVQSHKAIRYRRRKSQNHLWCPPWNSSPRDLQKTLIWKRLGKMTKHQTETKIGIPSPL
ncbi:uncharacterized protein [Apostichopus japonicus]|uniref:uncharacterized protein isoform X2 n=1 Tax=Stichopus japonicus TaxID=307972 RepID=UPI003AB77989